MEKIELGTPDGAAENIEKISELFPQVITEVENAKGELERAVDFDALRDLLGDVAEGERERYQFTWPGKREAKAEACRPVFKTMCPELSKSKDWDTTENLYIEGDNLDALKILRETYAGKVKLIYIDPPYNTGSDLIYEDDFSMSNDAYSEVSSEYAFDGGRLVANTESNGRFHSDWCSMIFSRLLLAKDLLSADGLIFISIGQSELHNLLKMCDELFGSQNRAGLVSRQMKTGNNQGKFFTQNTDFIVVYARDANFASPLKDDMSPELIEKVYNKVQKTGPRAGQKYRTMGLFQASLKHGGSTYPITCPDGERVITPKGLPWRWNESSFKEGLANDEIVFIQSNKTPLLNADTGKPANWNIYTKIWLDARLNAGQLPSDLMLKTENRHAAKELSALGIPFDFPKPSPLLKHLFHLVQDKDYLVLDFFGGSSTTADALMQLNADDRGNRKFILVQLNEAIDQNSQAYISGYRYITDIGEERIRRAGEKIRAEVEETNRQLELGAEPKPVPDIGFRVLRIDSSNFKDFYLTPGETSQESLFDFADNVKEGRSDLDLLFEVLPKLGIPYSAKIEERVLAGKKVYFVDGDKLAACFDANVGSDTIEEMAKAKPWYAVIRDSSMADDATHANYEELFRTYSPDTVPQVI